MNIINKKPISALGYDFIAKEFLPKGKNEYYLRNKQNRSGHQYRQLTATEIKQLKKNDNTADDWNKILVTDGFNPQLVRNCSFYGLVRIGRLESYYVEFNNLNLPVGLYNSTIISSDIGNNVAIDDVAYLSHYIIGDECILVNINELATTNHAKFGNGVVKQGEKESVRIWMEICNENAGRSILPFNGIQPADAWLWAKYRDNEKLLDQFKKFTDKRFDTKRGYYGKIGDRTVVKNSKIIKDVWMGSDAYIKGANKIKNITINSSPKAKTQIGEGCELVNGIIGFGCRIFYGVKAVRFVMGDNAQLKYGARLINSYLGDNSTISCCEVLNSLIFPAHEQHHNNSFLCAATILGQSNMAAGATIGSNHNSRSADGELLAGRGFWPGLCVSLKFNSKFAAYTIIAKGDFSSELNIPIPFSLVSNDVSNDRLVIMPGYWFKYNMYALARNSGKYEKRDKRVNKYLHIEYDFLAPDTINEMITALDVLATLTAKAWAAKHRKKIHAKDVLKKGHQLLTNETAICNELEITTDDFENANRKTVLLKVPEAYKIFKELILLYGVQQLLQWIDHKNINNWQQCLKALPKKPNRNEWVNIGGPLVPASSLHSLIRKINAKKINSWDEVHAFYQQKTNSYPNEKFRHAFAALLEVLKIPPSKFTKKLFLQLLQEALATKEWMYKGIIASRAKDYTNPFRTMMYETEKEMEKVIGQLGDNDFIQQEQTALNHFATAINTVTERFR